MVPTGEDVIRAAGIDKIRVHPEEEIAGNRRRRLDIYIPSGESMIVEGVDPSCRPYGDSRAAHSAPITISRRAFSKKMQVKGRSWWVRLSVQDLILTSKINLKMRDSACGGINVNPRALLEGCDALANAVERKNSYRRKEY